VMVNRSDRDPLSLDLRPSFELSGEMRRGSAKSIRARRLRPAKQAGYKPAASSVAHHTKETLHIGRRPYKTQMHLFDLTGRSAIVTGSSRGIGLAIAQRLAEHGAQVVISSRKADACATAAGRINADLGRDAAVPLPASISSKSDLQYLVDAATARFGKVDILVCNAASNPYYGSLAGIDDAQFRKIFENNVLANHWLAQLVAPQMIERRDGSIVIVSSVAGLRATAVIGAYGISKAADMALARNLALEWGPHNVRVNCVAPGLVKTDFARALWEDPVHLTEATASTPLRRIGLPHEIAGAAVFLASAAGSFVTGHTLVVDGGATIV